MIDPHDDRHRVFDRLRANDPVHRDQASASFILTRMADARGWLNDPAQWKDADRAEPDALIHAFKPADMNRPGDRDSGIGWMDDPDHARVRRPIQAALLRRAAALGPVVEAIVSDRIESLPAGGFDVLGDYAAPIPVAVIGHLLGVDTADFDQFRAWSEAALAIFDADAPEESRRATKAASEAMSDYLDEAMAARRRRPRDDLISDLLAEQAAAGALSDSEIRVNCFNLLLGGNVTTADLIANGVNLLLRHPDQLRRLRADPALIGPAVEEILRFDPPTGGTQRVASRDLDIRGCPIRARQVVAVMIAAANRDPAAFPDPHRFDIARRDGAHIAFGGGPHLCIGAPLARLEAKVAIARLLERFPTLRLAEPEEPARWRPTPFFHGLEALRVLV
jgi:cytochrome P450